MELSDEEQEIISRYRQLSHAQKKAVLASENSFESWIKTAMEWLWERISKAIIEMLFDYLQRFLL